MESKILKVVKYVGLSVFTMGFIMFSIGFFVSDYSILISIGLGTVIGAVFIFLIGVFFVATEEMLNKTYKGIKKDSIQSKKGAPL